MTDKTPDPANFPELLPDDEYLALFEPITLDEEEEASNACFGEITADTSLRIRVLVYTSMVQGGQMTQDEALSFTGLSFFESPGERPQLFILHPVPAHREASKH